MLKEPLNHPVVWMEFGPVIALAESVALKMGALHDRALPRDVLDAHGAAAQDGEAVEGRNAFGMPGWEQYSTWGLDAPLGRTEDAYLYAQLYRNTDDPNDRPRIWITPPRYILTSLDQLAEAIATELAPYEPIQLPTELIRAWLVH